ncbi:iron ABC transporter ATP-binding protein [Clostridium difficile BI1] [Clostridioides difficile]|nr:iron ABC transporter ATP-binding protein [Clostridium difficile BI1] [Clostridioides difficile]
MCYIRYYGFVARAVSLSLRFFFFFQAEDGIRDFCLSRGLGDVYKRQLINILKKLSKEKSISVILSLHEIDLSLIHI